jgi:hypothetical protein
MAGQFTAMGIPLTTAVKIAQKFVPSAEIDDETMEALGAGEAEGMDQQMWDAMNAGRDMDNGMGQYPMQ